MNISSDLKYIKSDLISAISVAALSMPVAIAYAEMVGLPPESGVFTAIFALICYYFLGSSKELILGPDSATIALLASSVVAISGNKPELFAPYIVLLSLFSGILFFIAGYFKLGFIANFLSKPILTGFLNGIAFILIISQLQKFTGVNIEHGHSIDGLFEFFSKIETIHIPTLLTGMAALAIIWILKSISGKIPSQFVLIVIAIICTVLFSLNKFGIALTPEISSSVPQIIIPDFSLLKGKFSEVLFSSMAIVFLSYTNEILTARSFSKDKHAIKPNREFFAIGVADIVCGLFRGYPVSGAESRTAINIKTGSKSKMSGLLAAGLMLIVIVFFSKEFSFIPMAVFGAVIIDAALGIFNFKEMKEIRKFSRPEFFISLLCLVSVLLIGVLNGILLSILLSFLMLIRKSSTPEEYEMVYDDKRKLPVKQTNKNKELELNGILIYRYNSAILFYNSGNFREKILKSSSDKKDLKLIIIDAAPINIIDISARNEIVDVMKELSEKNIKIVFVESNDHFERSINSGLKNFKPDYEIFPASYEEALALVI